MNTASGLTFIGWLGQGNAQDGHGFLEAQDTKTGASLWKSAPMTHRSVLPRSPTR